MNTRLRVRFTRKQGELLEVITAWEHDPEWIDRACWVEWIDGQPIVAIDNRDGCCWVEEFETVEQAIEWLWE